MLRYLSVCSGIEAASVAFQPYGWKPVAFAEVDRAASNLLRHHYPETPNWGDMTKFEEWPSADIDVLCGGTPCQSFSVAGLRQGLADARGNLTLTYLAIAAKYRPRWLVWENVPGVFSANSHDAPDTYPPDINLDGPDGPEDGKEVVVEESYDSDEDHAFACFLAGLQELGYGFAYRTLDAQYVRTRRLPLAVPQRRRRVFVVGYLGDWRRAAAVLFDRESLSGHPAPRREAGQRPAGSLAARTTGGGGLGTDFDLDGGIVCAEIAPTLDACFHDKQGLDNQHINGGGDCSSVPPVSLCLNAGGMGRIDGESETFIPVARPQTGGVFDVAHALRGEGFDASEDGTGRGTPIVPVAPTLRAGGNLTGGHRPPGTDVDTVESLIPVQGQHEVARSLLGKGNNSLADDLDTYIAEAVTGPLTAGMHKSAARMPQEQGTLIPEPLGFSAVDSGGDAQDGLAPTLRAMGHASSHPNAGGHAAVAFDLRGREGGAQLEGPHDTAAIRSAEGGSSRSYVAAAWAVRRLTPRECERLQGFRDGYTDVPVGNRRSADGPRYKQLGNSWAVNCADWLAERITIVDGWNE